MNFKRLNEKIQYQFSNLVKTGKLFTVNITGKSLWDTYLSLFDENPIWRVNSVHNCNSDRHFFERYANVVAIVDNKIITMFDFDIEGEYKKSIEAVSNRIKKATIDSIFIESFNELKNLGSSVERNKLNSNQSEFRLGNEKTLKEYRNAEEAMGKEIGKVYTFNHFNVLLPKQFVDFSTKSYGQILGELNTTRQLFQKGLSIPLETLELVRDLINQGSLLRGDMYLNKVIEFIKLKKEFNLIPSKEQNNWIWLNFQTISFARFANELIGVTCIELAEGKDINKVCKDFNIRVDPTNYNKAKSPVTRQMIELAEKTIVELGYENSFERRFATINDIDVSEIKHTNVDNAKEKPVGLFAKAGVVTTEFNRHKRAEFDKVETITIDKFMEFVLPNATSVEVFMENRFEDNLVSLFTTQNKSAKNLFKWNNPFSWTYNGNLSGKSFIKDNVKAVGGKLTGVLRCSLQWNDDDTKGIVDLDLHCSTPKGHVYYSSKLDNRTSTWLDIDMVNPSKIGIENITVDTWKVDGVYLFYVKNYSKHNNFKGFKAEIEVDGNTYNYFVNKSFLENINIATVTVRNGVVSIEHRIPETSSARNLWNLEINNFHKVNLICTSPNHWGDNNIGTNEYFFMLQDCMTSEPMRAFHIDQLNSELMANRKAIDLLGNYKMIEPSDKQLSGLGFQSTVRDEIILKVKGTHSRVLKIQF
jgi:hypothetical protein